MIEIRERQVKDLAAKIEACLVPENSRPVDEALQRAADNPSGKRMRVVAKQDRQKFAPSVPELFKYLWEKSGRQEASLVAAVVVALAYWCYETNLHKVTDQGEDSTACKAAIEMEVRNPHSRPDIIIIVDKAHGLHFTIEVKSTELPTKDSHQDFIPAVNQLIRHIVGCEQPNYQPCGLLVFRDRSFFILIQNIQLDESSGSQENEKNSKYNVTYQFQHLTVSEELAFRRFQCEASALVTGSMEGWQGQFDEKRDGTVSVEMDETAVEKFQTRKTAIAE